MMSQINSIEHILVSTSAWLTSHGFLLKNREWASLFWLGILAVWLLPQAQVRESLISVVRAAMSPKLLMIWASFITWIVLIVVIANWWKVWDQRLTKHTVLWVATAGLALLGNFTKAHEEGFFSQSVLKIIGTTAFVEYYVNLRSFSLLFEILLQPVVLLFMAAPILLEAPEDRQRWQVRSNYFFLILLVVFLGNTTLSLISNWDSVDWRPLGLPRIWLVCLGLWVLPLVFILGLVSSYEGAFVKLKIMQPDRNDLWKSKLGLILELGLNLKLIHHVTNTGTYNIANAQSVQSARQATRALINEWIKEKKAEQIYQENLVKFAGNLSADGHGRLLDKREFRETRAALDWLGICHMNWFRREPIGYKHDLLDRLGDDFTRQGLPLPSGIVMKVSDDGTKWYAWRRTAGGHHFAIGSNGEPPNEWRYDGSTHPTDFPGVAKEWGESPFDSEVAKNWYK